MPERAAQRREYSQAASAPRNRNRGHEVAFEHCANARRLWQAMGEPEYLSAREKQQLHAASEVAPQPLDWKHENNTHECRCKTSPHGLAAVHFKWKTDAASRAAGAPCP